MFNDILGDKVQDALDAEKIAVADEIFNGVEPVEFDDEEEVEDDATSEVEYGSENLRNSVQLRLKRPKKKSNNKKFHLKNFFV